MSVVDPFRCNPPDFEVSVVRRRDHVLVRPEGELDISTVDAVRAEVLTLAVRRCRRIVLDLSRLLFADSCLIHLLLELEAAAAGEGFELVVQLGEEAPAQRLLARVGLAGRFALA